MSISKSDHSCPLRYPDVSITESIKIWWIAKVKPNQEKALAADLYEKSIEYYVPCYMKTYKRADCNSTRKSLIPLFPSYVPFALDIDPWFLLQSNRISTIIQIKAQKKFKLELNQIYMANERKISLLPTPASFFFKGQKVKVVSGPLAGLAGNIVDDNISRILLLRVDYLGNACVSIDSSNVVIYTDD